MLAQGNSLEKKNFNGYKSQWCDKFSKILFVIFLSVVALKTWCFGKWFLTLDANKFRLLSATWNFLL